MYRLLAMHVAAVIMKHNIYHMHDLRYLLVVDCYQYHVLVALALYADRGKIPLEALTYLPMHHAIEAATEGQKDKDRQRGRRKRRGAPILRRTIDKTTPH